MGSNFKCHVHPYYQGIYPPRKDQTGHVCEMCDWVWHASPNFKEPQRRIWRHGESSYTLAAGGDKFGEYLKSKALKIVKVVTDDSEINFGLLIRNDEDGQIRVGHRVSTVKFKDNEAQAVLNMKRRTEWRLDAIARDRITELRVLS